MSPFRILLVEDNPGDVALTREALRETPFESELDVASDGVEALAWLRERATRGRAPDLVLLDLNLPRKNGRELLQELRQDPLLGIIPVVVTTTSTDPGDVARAYELRANCYVSKPAELEAFMGTVRSVIRFWSSVAVLPTRDPARPSSPSPRRP